jgi:thymidylate synthase ThyX
MRVTQVALIPTEASQAKGRPALTPELLAATGARYSRNIEGLEAILSRIDPANLDRSVESIFRMIDYGHQSIADMAPVAMFIDGISIWLAYYVWSRCPTAGGQESSTRYIRMNPDLLASAEALGISPGDAEAWSAAMSAALKAFDSALELWEGVLETHPEAARIPQSLLADKSDRAGRQVARMKRNYAFDRARYFLPAALRTNMMLVMSARGWVQLCQALLSYPLQEANRLGNEIREELALAAPRLIRHATAKPSFEAGLRAEFETSRRLAEQGPTAELKGCADHHDRPVEASLEISAPPGAAEEAAADLQFHDNRYAWIGPSLQRTMVRFGWNAVALAEIRDLNRHRTGSKYCSAVPMGFYAAGDQADVMKDATGDFKDRLQALSETGREISLEAHRRLAAGNPGYVYWLLLGTQLPFEHTTTADKFLYEAELRTGTGAHYRYADHLHAALELWYARYPETRGVVIEGSAEPE